MSCLLCDGPRRQVFQAKVLHRYDADFVYCDTCGLLQAAEPTWLDEAYLSPLATADTGAVERNLQLRHAASVVWGSLFTSSARLIDLAAGSGLLTRLMRDAGFDYWWSDPYMKNIFAEGYEARTGDTFDGATAIEVFEHLPNPLEFLEVQLHNFGPSVLLFTTQLFDGEPPARDWWYYTFPTGQHISFYQRRTLQRLADMVGMKLTSVGGLHLFAREAVPERVLRLAGSRFAPLAARWLRRGRPSLIGTDHDRALRRGLSVPGMGA